MSIHINTEKPELGELRKYYERQENYANYPLDIRLRAIDGAVTELKQGINIDDNFQFLVIIWPTLGI